MVDQPLKLIEAFRVLLRVIHPHRPELADKVTGIDCFVRPKRHGISPLEHDALKMARACLNKYVREGRIRLLGILEGTEYPQEPHEIHPIDCAKGELNIWEGALEIVLVPEKRWNVYRRVHAVAADVRAVAAAIATTHVDRSRVEVYRTGAPGRP
jgi:hypothetical protein